jgi:hypothetical protein
MSERHITREQFERIRPLFEEAWNYQTGPVLYPNLRGLLVPVSPLPFVGIGQGG